MIFIAGSFDVRFISGSALIEYTLESLKDNSTNSGCFSVIKSFLGEIPQANFRNLYTW